LLNYLYFCCFTFFEPHSQKELVGKLTIFSLRWIENYGSIRLK